MFAEQIKNSGSDALFKITLRDEKTYCSNLTQKYKSVNVNSPEKIFTYSITSQNGG
jgi:hypothetical protein